MCEKKKDGGGETEQTEKGTFVPSGLRCMIAKQLDIN
jgi:hypothetical protein